MEKDGSTGRGATDRGNKLGALVLVGVIVFFLTQSEYKLKRIHCELIC